jgi:hypothetical protein
MADVIKIKRERKSKNTSLVKNEVVALAEPTASAEHTAIAEPTVEPSAEPTVEPSAEHTVEPSAEHTAIAEPTVEPSTTPTESKMPKKRGRKPKGGKIIQNNFSLEATKSHEPNIIMHLKCGENDLIQNSFISSIVYEPNVHSVETFQFENSKSNDLGYSVIDYGAKDYVALAKDFGAKEYNEIQSSDSNEKKNSDSDETRLMWAKLKELTYQLHTNSISDKKSACFWCTCEFDNPTILIPKFELNKIYHCYGCFCSPECATAYLFEEPIDTSTRFERYHLLNHIYCKIYNYEKNIKPAPNPYYILNKYYGNLSIQEYRKLLKNERLLLVVDKPLSRVLPELHEDNDDYMFNGATISTSNKFKLRRKTKQTKTDILSDTFNMGGKPPLPPT